MILHAQSKFNIDRAFKFCIVLLVILSLMLSWFCIPKADAIAGTIIVAGVAVALETVVSVLLTMILASVGVDFTSGMLGEGDIMGTGAYEVGNKFAQTVSTWSTSAQEWLAEQVERFTDKKGFASGDAIDVPVEVLEYSRNWFNEHYDVSNGPLSMSKNYIIDDVGNIIYLSPYSGSQYFTSISNLTYVGSVLDAIVHDFYDSSWETGYMQKAKYWLNGVPILVRQIITSTGIRYVSQYGNSQYGTSIYGTDVASYTGLAYREATNEFHLVIYRVDEEGIRYSCRTSDEIDATGIEIYSDSTTVNGTDSLANPQTQDKTVYIPDLPLGTISGFNVPIFEQLTQDMVIDGTVPDVDTGDDSDAEEGEEEKPGYIPDLSTWEKFVEWLKDKTDGITDTLEGILEGIKTPQNNIEDTSNKLLPVIKDGFGFVNIWHYVVSWIGSIGAFLGMLFTVWSGLPYAMVVPIYATAVIVIVIGMYRRFFM